MQPNEKQPIQLSVTLKRDANPLSDGFASIEIQNNTADPIEVWSRLPVGVDGFIDVAVVDAQKQRISKEFAARIGASPFSEPRLSATIPRGKSIKTSVNLFEGVPAGQMKPGKYKCYVQFVYETHKGVSQELEIEVTEKHLREKDE